MLGFGDFTRRGFKLQGKLQGGVWEVELLTLSARGCGALGLSFDSKCRSLLEHVADGNLRSLMLGSRGRREGLRSGGVKL